MSGTTRGDEWGGKQSGDKRERIVPLLLDFSHHEWTCRVPLVLHALCQMSCMQHCHLSPMRSATCHAWGCQASTNSYFMHACEVYYLLTQNLTRSLLVVSEMACGYMHGHAKIVTKWPLCMSHARPPLDLDSRGEPKNSIGSDMHAHATLLKLRVHACHMQDHQ